MTAMKKTIKWLGKQGRQEDQRALTTVCKGDCGSERGYMNKVTIAMIPVLSAEKGQRRRATCSGSAGGAQLDG